MHFAEQQAAHLQFEAHVLFVFADEVEHGDGDLHLTAVDPIDEQSE